MGPRGSAEGAGTPWLAPLATALLQWAAGWAYVAPPVVPNIVLACRWAFPFIFLVHFCFTPFKSRLLLGFPLVFKCSHAKHVSSNTSGTMLIVKTYMLKVCLFPLFWILIGGQN